MNNLTTNSAEIPCANTGKKTKKILKYFRKLKKFIKIEFSRIFFI
jgi:hypothetical protein